MAFLSCFMLVIVLVFIVLIPVLITKFLETTRQKIAWLAVYFLCLGIAFFFVFSYSAFKYRGRFYRECGKNLEKIGTEIKLYAADNDDKYPDRLEQVDPDIHKRQFDHGGDAGCPFYAGYTASSDNSEYTLWCTKDTHDAPKGYPQYTSEKGLLKPTRKYLWFRD